MWKGINPYQNPPESVVWVQAGADEMSGFYLRQRNE
jgi:hypothetical protein